MFFRVNWPTSWGPYLTTYFVDPLTFGSYSILFAMLTFLGLSKCWTELGWSSRLLCFFGIISGIILSIESNARTGWFNLPIFFIIWYFSMPRSRDGLIWKNFIIFGIIIFTISILVFNGNLLSKFFLIWSEISEYKLNQMNKDTSVGLRLTFYRMGFQFFTERPFSGWGDLSWLAQINREEFTQFASQYARESPRHGFHNEIITNAVRSGVWGLLASISLFVIVFMRSIQGIMKKSKGDLQLISLTLLVIICHLFIAGLTTEITNLVFLSSFIGLTFSALLGEQIYLEEKNLRANAV
jgi:O-antigen ligase